MINHSGFITDVQTNSQDSQHNQTQNQPDRYPARAFPPILRNVIEALHEETQIPIELIGSTVLASSALALQPIVDIIPPYSREPEPCSLYILNMARSGEGKSTLNRILMKPFYEFSLKMKKEYNSELATYKKDHRLWNVTRRALESEYCKAVKNNDSEVEKLILQEHLDNEPTKPATFNIIYEDATPKSIVEGLNQYPYGGIISDEAITFFTGYTKNNLGLLNKTWSGDAYTLQRSKEEDITINACLTLSLMVQPGIFIKYLEKHFDTAASSGFLSRFLYSKSETTIGSRRSDMNENQSKEYIEKFHQALNIALEKQKIIFNDAEKKKTNLTLSSEAIALFKRKYGKYQELMADGNQWGHIQSIGAKAGTNAIRVAGIIHEMENISNSPYIAEISSATLKDAFSIIDWYMEQASTLFYPMSPQYAFIQDVHELFDWIKNHFKNTSKNSRMDPLVSLLDVRQPFEPFPKRDIETHGPNRLRRLNKLNPVLNELVGLGLISIIQCMDNGSLYIVAMQPEPYYAPVMPLQSSRAQRTILSKYHTKPIFNNYNMALLTWL